MLITNVRARTLSVPVEYPLLEATSAGVLVVEIDTDTGISGHALAAYPMHSAMSAVLNGDIARVLAGVDPTRHELIRSMLMTSVTNRTLGGVWAAAASLVDIALWDITGKALGQPIWKLLGGAREAVDTYVTFGLPRYTIDQLVDAAQTLVDSGHHRLKMVVGASSDPQRELFGTPTRADIRQDARRVAAVRKAVGPDVELMIDANKNPTLPQAVDLARSVEEFDIAWFEDPVAMCDVELLAELRQRTSIPVAAGSLGTGDPRVFREVLVAKAADIVQPNVRDIGGYTGGRKAAALAEAFNVPMAMGGNWPHLNMHLYGGCIQGTLVEFHLQGWSVAAQLYTNAPEPKDGVLELPQAPGLGLELDHAAIDRFAC